MLPVDGIELAAGLGNLAGIEVCETLIVEHFRRIGLDRQLGDVDVLVGAAGYKQWTGGRDCERDQNAMRRFLHTNRTCKNHRTIPNETTAYSPQPINRFLATKAT